LGFEIRAIGSREKGYRASGERVSAAGRRGIGYGEKKSAVTPLLEITYGPCNMIYNCI
jgi:hypothetical protein